jgi:UDP-N-acetylmuramyl pentapeptide phosphotransferase/UDP-N-acetylglucosamine-1-phosphate transferase
LQESLDVILKATMTNIVLTLFAFTCSYLLTRYFCSVASRFHVLDHPNERSLHDHPTPRNGGLAILTALGLTWPIAMQVSSPADGIFFLLVGAIMVGLISFWDDRTSLSPGKRILVQFMAALLLVLGKFGVREVALPAVGTFSLGWFGIPATLLFTVWFINLYNFMDGMDGFAGGMGALGFGFLACLGWLAGQDFFALSGLLIAGANLGFLLCNFPPARIFMGDAGSTTMGFLAAGMSLWGVRDGLFPIWIPILIFSPFIVDATVTLIRRLGRGDKVWQAHRSHYYQRLVLLGWGHKRTVLVEYFLMLSTGFSAVFFVQNSSGHMAIIGLLGWVVIYALLAVGVHRLEKGKMASSSWQRSPR